MEKFVKIGIVPIKRGFTDMVFRTGAEKPLPEQVQADCARRGCTVRSGGRAARSILYGSAGRCARIPAGAEGGRAVHAALRFRQRGSRRPAGRDDEAARAGLGQPRPAAHARYARPRYPVRNAGLHQVPTALPRAVLLHHQQRCGRRDVPKGLYRLLFRGGGRQEGARHAHPVGRLPPAAVPFPSSTTRTSCCATSASK